VTMMDRVKWIVAKLLETLMSVDPYLLKVTLLF